MPETVQKESRGIREELDQIVEKIEAMGLHEKIQALNEIRRCLHEISPFREEPVDCIQWIPESAIISNTYNPNSVAKPEMELLAHSIRADGYTQPIVGFAKKNQEYEVVDGFHRNRIGKEDPEIRERIHGYLPMVIINEGRKGLKDRMASTIRHNRARGRHQVGAMSEIVMELSRRKWKDERIAKELGMTADEVLRLKQITGLAEAFQDREFSEAWEADLGEVVEE